MVAHLDIALKYTAARKLSDELQMSVNERRRPYKLKLQRRHEEEEVPSSSSVGGGAGGICGAGSNTTAYAVHREEKKKKQQQKQQQQKQSIFALVPRYLKVFEHVPEIATAISSRSSRILV